MQVARRLTDEHVFLCRANDSNVYSTLIYLHSLPRALHVPWELVCINGTEHQRTFQLQVTAVTVSVETMNHRHSTWDELWQHLTRVTNVSHDMAVAMVRLHVQEMCEVSWKAPIHPCKLPMPMNVFWKLSAADNTVTGFLSSSLARRRGRKITGETEKNKVYHPQCLNMWAPGLWE